MKAGIWAIGVHLPEEVRTNDWWPKSTVETWRVGLEQKVEQLRAIPPDQLSTGQQLVVEAVIEAAAEPFQGALERRIAPDEATASELEIAAAEDAIARSGVDAADIDMVLGFSLVPDYITVPNACIVHEALGLPEQCLTMGTEAACNAFNQQLDLAATFIEAGRARFVLLSQSNLLRRIIPSEAPYSPWFGDGATAVVVGPVSESRGLQGRYHLTDGSYARAMVGGVPGGRWYDGPTTWHAEDRDQATRMLLNVPDHGKQAVNGALSDAGLTPRDVNFFASHQATGWFRPLAQRFVGLDRARSVDTFATAGSLSSANVPLVLATAERQGLLHDGDVIATYSGGSGITWSSMILRWGR